MIYWLIVVVIGQILITTHSLATNETRDKNTYYLAFLAVCLGMFPPMIWAIVKLWNV